MSTVEIATRLPVARAAGFLPAARRGLDRLYKFCGYLAAASLATIFALTLAQVGGRMLGIPLRGLSDYAGYCLGASAFLAFAHALNSGSHVRIELFLSLLGRFRAVAEGLALGLASAVAVWFAYHFTMMAYWSYELGDISTSLDATPLWIPQAAMAAGAIVFAVAAADNFLMVLFTGSHRIPPSADGA